MRYASLLAPLFLLACTSSPTIGQTAAEPVTITTSCTLPGLPSSVTETTPSYGPNTAHNWGYVTYPPSGTATRFAFVLIHPGAWGDAATGPGTHSGGDAWCGTPGMQDTRQRLAAMGGVGYTICHRPYTVAVFPAQEADEICARRTFASFLAGGKCMANLCADQAACSADSDCAGHSASVPTIVMGSSSGAHLALLDVLSIGAAPSAFEDGTCPLSGVRPPAAGVVPWSGIYDLNSAALSSQAKTAVKNEMGFYCSTNTAACAAASPITYVVAPDGGTQVPIYIAHGSTDGVLPVGQANEQQAYDADAGLDSTEVVWDGGEHAPGGLCASAGTPSPCASDQIPFDCTFVAFIEAVIAGTA